MAGRIIILDTSVPKRGDLVIVDIGAEKRPVNVQFGEVEGREKGRLLVRLPPIFNQDRSRLQKVDLDDATVVISASDRRRI